MELNSSLLDDLNIKIQEFLFNKSSKKEVAEYLNNHNLQLENLIGNLFRYQACENDCDTLITIIDKIFRWDEFKSEFINILLQPDQDDKIFLIKSPLVKNYFIEFVKKNLDQFYEQDFLYNLIKVYLVDENSGVYEKTLDLLIYMYKYNQGTIRNYLISKNFIMSLVTYFENIRGENSIILIRELETILNYLETEKENKEVEDILKKISSKFVEYDLLTQLAFLDTIEKKIQSENLAVLILNEINFFQLLSLGENISNETLRKFMYTMSKFYAAKFITDVKTIKNYLSVSLQYYQDNKENYFIMSIILNSFYNRDMFSFLMDPNNNTQINFQGDIIQIIVDNYYDHDPKVKQQALEVFSIICNFSIPSSIQEQFLKKVLDIFYFYENNKSASSDKEAFTFFVNQLYKDFRTHDFEEYEYIFLETLLNVVTFEPLLKTVSSTFDLILYLLNRRIRRQEVCLKKFEIIKALFKSNFALSGGIEKNLLEQFANYISKGPY